MAKKQKNGACCRQCGNKLIDGSVFCDICGTRVLEDGIEEAKSVQDEVDIQASNKGSKKKTVLFIVLGIVVAILVAGGILLLREFLPTDNKCSDCGRKISSNLTLCENCDTGYSSDYNDNTNNNNDNDSSNNKQQSTQKPNTGTQNNGSSKKATCLEPLCDNKVSSSGE